MICSECGDPLNAQPNGLFGRRLLRTAGPRKRRPARQARSGRSRSELFHPEPFVEHRKELLSPLPELITPINEADAARLGKQFAATFLLTSRTREGRPGTPPSWHSRAF